MKQTLKLRLHAATPETGVGWLWNTCIVPSECRRAPDRKLLATFRSVLRKFKAHLTSIESAPAAEASMNAFLGRTAAFLFPTALLSAASQGRLVAPMRQSSVPADVSIRGKSGHAAATMLGPSLTLAV